MRTSTPQIRATAPLQNRAPKMSPSQCHSRYLFLVPPAPQADAQVDLLCTLKPLHRYQPLSFYKSHAHLIKHSCQKTRSPGASRKLLPELTRPLAPVQWPLSSPRHGPLLPEHLSEVPPFSSFWCYQRVNRDSREPAWHQAEKAMHRKRTGSRSCPPEAAGRT
jgi:hypothetical protein